MNTIFKNKVKNIGIFGGTFLPFHNGHINAIEEAHKNVNLDEIYVVPTRITPNKNSLIFERISLKFKEEMIKKTIESLKYKWLKYSNFEISKSRVSYTYLTIKYFKKRFPNANLYLIIAEDQYKNLKKWKNWQEIIENTTIVVVRRYEKKLVPSTNAKNIIILNNKICNISSTKILNNLNWKDLNMNTKQVIFKNYLFLKTLIHQNLPINKYKHSLLVASMAKKLAKKHSLDIEKAYIASLIHDLFKTKKISYLKSYYKKFVSELKPKTPTPPNSALHGYCCALWFREEYLSKDKEIFSAIWKHTIIEKNMSKLDKLIYIADKISLDRTYDKVNYFRKLALLNLDECFKQILINQLIKLKLKKIEISASLQKIYDYHINL